MKCSLAVSKDCMRAIDRLSGRAQAGFVKFVLKFTDNPDSPGINYEKINDAAHLGYRSVRIDQNHRGIVLKPEKGNNFLLVHVNSHDSAYAWARRKKCLVNAYTGMIQIYESFSHTDSDDSAYHVNQGTYGAESKANETASTAEASYTLGLETHQLLRIGTPNDYTGVLLSAGTRGEITALFDKLPQEVAEALELYMEGESWQSIEEIYSEQDEPLYDTGDIDAALTRGRSLSGFRVIDGEDELRDMLDKPLELWRTFLHPAQRKLVTRNWNGPVRILGGAGTGKTVVAMHRARWLAGNTLQPGEKILFSTFSANLAADISTALKSLCSADEFSKIEVIHIDKWIANFLRSGSYPFSPLFPGNSNSEFFWNKAIKSTGIKPAPSIQFLETEFLKVVVNNQITTREAYLSVSRYGRGKRLTRKERINCWEIFEAFKKHSEFKRYRYYPESVFDIEEMLQKAESPLYRSVIVDEIQDFSLPHLKLINALVPDADNNILLVGDAHQRIYGDRIVIGHSGIGIKGRGRKLKINYRTTHETKLFAQELLQGLEIDDLNGQLDSGSDYYSLTHGNDPVLKRFTTEEEEQDWIAETVGELCSSGERDSDICIVARTTAVRDKLATALKARGITTVVLKKGQDDRSVEGVRLSTMHRVKGLEFRFLFIASTNANIIPAADYSFEFSEKERLVRERALLHVAATRAIVRLFISGYGELSALVTQQ